MSYTYLYPKSIGDTFKLSDIDRNTGLDIESTNRTTCDFMDISGYSNIGYLSVSIYLGYQGNKCGTWNLICHFYDENKNFIKSTDAYQYRRVCVPSNAKFMRVTILNEVYPTNLSIQLFRLPTHCSFKNLYLENCRCIGIAPQAMSNLLFDSCELTNCGQSSAKCALDAEDGWDMMQDVTFRKLNFHDNPNNEFLTCAGHNFTIEDMIDGKIGIWDRTNSYVIKNCKNLKRSLFRQGSRSRTGYVRIYNNQVNANISVKLQTSDIWPLIIKDCIINGKAENDLGSCLYFRCDIGKHLTSTNKFDTALGSGNYLNCYIHDKDGENQGGIYYNCKIDNIIGNMQGSFKLYDCTINNWRCNSGSSSSNPNYLFVNCKLNNFNILFIYWFQGAITSFENCQINNIDYIIKLPCYSMKKPITFINNTFYSYGTNGMIYFYDDRTGGSAGELVTQSLLKLENNTINMPNSSYAIIGLNKNIVNNINILSNNNIYIPDTLLLCNPEAKLSSNISIIEI